MKVRLKQWTLDDGTVIPSKEALAAAKPAHSSQYFELSAALEHWEEIATVTEIFEDEEDSKGVGYEIMWPNGDCVAVFADDVEVVEEG